MSTELLKEAFEDLCNKYVRRLCEQWNFPYAKSSEYDGAERVYNILAKHAARGGEI